MWIQHRSSISRDTKHYISLHFIIRSCTAYRRRTLTLKWQLDRLHRMMTRAHQVGTVEETLHRPHPTVVLHPRSRVSTQIMNLNNKNAEVFIVFMLFSYNGIVCLANSLNVVSFKPCCFFFPVTVYLWAGVKTSGKAQLFLLKLKLQFQKFKFTSSPLLPLPAAMSICSHHLHVFLKDNF